MAAYRYHINRLNILPINKEEEEKEWGNIEKMAINKGFPEDYIKKTKDKIGTKKKRNKG